MSDVFAVTDGPPAAAPGPDGRSWALQFTGGNGQPIWDWLHFDLVHTQTKATLEADPRLPLFARAIPTSTDEQPRLATDGAVVAGIIPSYARTGDAEEFELTCWRFAMEPDLLITCRRRATQALANIWETVRGKAEPDSPAALVNLCIAEFIREVRERLATLGGDRNVVEDVLLELRGDAGRLTHLGRRLGGVRREAARLKRVLAPLERAFHDGEDEMPAWTRPSGLLATDRLLHGALDDIATLYDRGRALQDELTTRLAEETNRRLYVVSIVTTVAMPATFLTGFFGMNTGGLLWGGDGTPRGTLYATLMCGTAVVVTLLLLRWKRLL
jgi:Mg2+ and Co2+ transporter CorA